MDSTFILDTAVDWSEKQSCCVDRSTAGRQHTEERWELNCSPPQHHKLSSHCLGPAPGAGVIAAVWHCGEYFAFLLSQGSFSSFLASHCNLPQIKHVSNSVVSTVALRQCRYVCLHVKGQKSQSILKNNNYGVVKGEGVCGCVWRQDYQQSKGIN